eukprot:2521382-Ditylum_brightwellii.AAC.1
MPVSKNVTLRLRGGGLKDDHDSIDNVQNDTDEKIMHAQSIKVLVRECLLVLQWPAKIAMVLTSTEDTLLMISIVIMHQEEDVMVGATILIILIIIVHQQ